ncbi:MAG TPA: hypothetical protein VKV18_14900 [Chthonomonas sp.]|nr:hypothetical protein [Chthonomonas sp.]
MLQINLWGQALCRFTKCRFNRSFGSSCRMGVGSSLRICNYFVREGSQNCPSADLHAKHLVPAAVCELHGWTENYPDPTNGCLFVSRQSEYGH